MTHPRPAMRATIRLKAEQLDKIRTWVGLTTDAALAQRMGVDAGNLSRILAGKQQPGSKFIAALCSSLKADFDDLFEIVRDDQHDSEAA